MSAYSIPLPNLELPPDAISDIGWLIQYADPELWAPRHYLIVDEKCKGDHHLIATWFAIYRLLIFYKPIGKRAFGQREIAAVGRVGRGHLSGKNGTIRKLAALELIIIDGYEGGEGDEGKPIFRIDTARLEAESILLMRQRLSAGQLVQRRKPGAQGQLDMFRMLGLTPDEGLLTLAQSERQGDEYLKLPEVAPTGADLNTTSDQLAPMGAGLVNTREGWHQSEPASAPPGAILEGNWHPGVPSLAPIGAAAGAVRHPEAPVMAPIGATYSDHEAIWHPSVPPRGQLGAARHPSGPLLHEVVAPTGGAAAPTESTLAPAGASGWMDHENERRGERAAPSAATLTQDSLSLMVQQAMAQHLPALVAVALQHTKGAPVSNFGHTTLTDDIPSRPCPEEPELHRGLLSTWQIVSKQNVIPARDLAQLEVLVSRYDGPTGGHAAYWLCRVMWEADRSSDGNEPIRLRVVGGYMRRMEQEKKFNTVTLESKKKPEKEGGAQEREAVQTPLQEAPAAPRPAPSSTSRASSPATSGLPPELAGHWVIATWRSFAGADAVILPDRAQHLIATVARRDVWEAVLANWRDKYKSKANWTQFDGLMDWYSREAAKPVAVTADEYDPDGPPPSASVIDNHLGLGDTRGDWYRRFHSAGDSKAARQAVIRRLLAEHPIEPNTEPKT